MESKDNIEVKAASKHRVGGGVYIIAGLVSIILGVAGSVLEGPRNIDLSLIIAGIVALLGILVLTGGIWLKTRHGSKALFFSSITCFLTGAFYLVMAILIAISVFTKRLDFGGGNLGVGINFAWSMFLFTEAVAALKEFRRS